MENKNFKLYLAKLRPLLTIPVVIVAFIILMMFYSVPIALGLISLSLTVLSGTTVIQKKFQYFQLPSMKKPADLILVNSVAVAIVATIWGALDGSLKTYESITYAILIIILVVIIYFSAKENIKTKKP